MLDFTNARQPSIPRSKTNPVGQTRRIGKAIKAARKDIVAARSLALEAVASWPYEIKNDFRANAFYEFFVDVGQLTALVDAIRRTLASGGGAEAVREAARGAYSEGVARAVDNLAGLSSDYPRGVNQHLASAETLKRAALSGSRAFEQMQGFAGETAKDLARVLFEAIQSGENPRQTAKTIRARFGVSRTRAERIARTEITMAHRRGRWDEARDAEEKFGIRTMLIHNSALIAGRTRRSHAARHGQLFSRDEVAAWYASDGNAINCLCSQSEVTVDEDGKPLFGAKLLEKMEAQRTKFIGAGGGE